MTEKLFVLYDSRAILGDTDDACIYVTASTEIEAILDGQNEAWADGIWYEYKTTKDGYLTNGKVREDLPPFNRYLKK